MKALLPDPVWRVVEPLLPEQRRSAKGGRPPVSNRAALTGILFVLRTGIPWEYLPQEMGCGSGKSCWRRLRDWQKAGVWGRLHRLLLDEPGKADQIDWSRVCVDASSVPAPKGGAVTGKCPTDRGKAGSKHHLVTDKNGTPLVVQMTAANCNETTLFPALIDALPTIAKKRGRPRFKPDNVHADKACDSRANREHLKRLHIRARIARRGIESSEKLGRHRWVVERTFAWLHCFRRLRIRYERLPGIHEAFLLLGCSLICRNRLETEFC